MQCKECQAGATIGRHLHGGCVFTHESKHIADLNGPTMCQCVCSPFFVFWNAFIVSICLSVCICVFVVVGCVIWCWWWHCWMLIAVIAHILNDFGDVYWQAISQGIFFLNFREALSLRDIALGIFSSVTFMLHKIF